MKTGWRIAALALAGAAQPAGAAWLQATSAHFVIYADTGEAALLQRARELELYDALMRKVQGVRDSDDAQHNKVTVFVTPDVATIRRLIGSDMVAGFYVPRVTGSVAFTPERGDDDGSAGGTLTPRIVLFHEYAHHFLLGNFPYAFPAWFSEGYAEFASTAVITARTASIGGVARHRAYGLFADKALTITALFAPPARMTPEQVEALYARGWLLTHYIEFHPDRLAQFNAYLTLIDKGRDSLTAAKEAFGDLGALDRELGRYLSGATFPIRIVPAGTLPAPTVSVRPLTAGERAMIGLRMQSTRGVNDKTAGPLFARAKAVAASYPTDATAQGWLAEMAFDAGDDASATRAADAALAADPASSQALLYKARVLMRRAAAAKPADPALWTEARGWILKANDRDPDDAAALWLFYDSFQEQGRAPLKGAVAGLHRAVELVPQDRGLRFAAARQRLLDGDVADARALLRPLAFDPHASGENQAAKLLALLDAGRTGQAALDELAAAAKAAEDKAKQGAGK